MAPPTPSVASKAVPSKKGGESKHEPSSSLGSQSRAIQYLLSTYIKNAAASVPYCLVYGNPKTARVVLMVWTALTCPLCSRLHQGPLMALKKLAKKSGDFALILRDYPTDPLSLRGSTVVWSLEKKHVPDIMHRLYVTHDWMNPLDKALDALEILTLQSATLPKERAKIRSAKTDENLQKTVFHSRSADQKAMGLTQVPWAIILEKQEKTAPADPLAHRDQSPAKYDAVKQTLSHARLQKSQPLAKDSKPEHTNVEKTGHPARADWTMHVLGTPNMDVDQIVAKHLSKN